MGREYHRDGSYTDRNEDGTSITVNDDNTIREQTKHENAFFIGKEITVTYDGDGNEINRQDGWGDKE